jgi:hypothetical protein
MITEEEQARAADRLRDALGAAADLMGESPATVSAPRRPRPGRARLAPLVAGAAVLAVVLACVLLAGNIGRSGSTGGETTPGSGNAAGPPEFYLVLASTNNNNDATLEVRRTSDGALTYSEPFPGSGARRYLTADASGHFYIATWPTCTQATPVTTFYQITISDSGRITGYHAVGSPIQGGVLSLAVSPDGSQMAYTMLTGSCQSAVGQGPKLVTAIHVMNLSTGAVRTWRNTVTAPGPDRVTELTGGLSWTPDGRTVIAVAYWGTLGSSAQAYSNDISVLGLDTTGAGGSLQASSRVLLSQDQDCVSCVMDAIAGPDGSLTAVELKQGRQLVVRIPPKAGRAQTVLYSATAPPPADVDFYAVFANPSGRWVITWPPFDASKPSWVNLRAGWIRDGKLVSLPGSTGVYRTAIAW